MRGWFSNISQAETLNLPFQCRSDGKSCDRLSVSLQCSHCSFTLEGRGRRDICIYITRSRPNSFIDPSREIHFKIIHHQQHTAIVHNPLVYSQNTLPRGSHLVNKWMTGWVRRGEKRTESADVGSFRFTRLHTRWCRWVRPTFRHCVPNFFPSPCLVTFQSSTWMQTLPVFAGKETVHRGFEIVSSNRKRRRALKTNQSVANRSRMP